MPNRLAGETSPYLLQHKDNPVDWFPWGPEALAKAKQEDRPIFLSIGYSACHWCHVMEHESFEDPQTAEVMNALFVSIKVDREERPDLDSIYMQAVQTLTGRGGWPMSVFLTPAGQPFYGGTYYPPDDRHGMPSFTKVLMAVADAYQNKRSDVTDTAGQLTSRLQPAPVQGTEMLTVDLLQQACQSAKAQFEPAHGGFGSAPKFPQPMTLEFLLRCWARFGDSEALRMATFTMQKMARGGMYDQVGGGFHRYSTDAFWLVPHFEKMLYDNALLSRVYVQAAQATGEPFYRRVAEETFDYILKEMTHPSGAFYSTQDADSEGHEGKFFVWTPVQTAALPGRGRCSSRQPLLRGDRSRQLRRAQHLPRPVRRLQGGGGSRHARAGRLGHRRTGEGQALCRERGAGPSRPRRQGADVLERTYVEEFGRGRCRPGAR